MNCYLKLEYYRIVNNRRFWGAILIGCAIALFQFIIIAYPTDGVGETLISRWSLKNADAEAFRGVIGVLYPSPWYEYWLGGEWYSLFSYTFFMIFPVLAVISQGDSLVEDKLTGYSKHMFLRGTREHYYAARFLSSFVTGGVVIVVPLIFNILLCAATLPSILSQAATGTALLTGDGMWAALYFSHPMIYTLLYLVIDFVYGGLFAVLAAALGVMTRNRFLPLIFPMILYLFIYTVFAAAGLWKYIPFYFLTPCQRGAYGISFEIVLIEAIIIFVPSVIIFVWNAKKDETL